jgi:hypothetical protein
MFNAGLPSETDLFIYQLTGGHIRYSHGVEHKTLYFKQTDFDLSDPEAPTMLLPCNRFDVQ